MAETKGSTTQCECRMERAAVEPMLIVRGVVEHNYRPLRIVYCPVHAAAPALLDTLRTIADFAPGHGDVCEIIARRARAAIRAAEGKD